MSATNCVNCGHGKDPDVIKCPFCGTTYLDMKGIDFDSETPVVCEFILPKHLSGGKQMLMRMLARPKLDEIEVCFDTVSFSDGYHTKNTLVSYTNINVGVSFMPIESDFDGPLTFEEM